MKKLCPCFVDPCENCKEYNWLRDKAIFAEVTHLGYFESVHNPKCINCNKE